METLASDSGTRAPLTKTTLSAAVIKSWSIISTAMAEPSPARRRQQAGRGAVYSRAETVASDPEVASAGDRRPEPSPDRTQTYCFDIDGTLCITQGMDYGAA